MDTSANRFVGDLTRTELLAELRSHKDDDGLDHTATFDGQDVGDPKPPSDSELLELARWRTLLWGGLDE